MCYNYNIRKKWKKVSVMKKILVLILVVLCVNVESCKKNINKEKVDIISGLGYNGYERLMESFNNN